MFRADDLARMSGEYQTILTVTSFSVVGPHLALKANPKRWYVRFDQVGGVAGVPRVFPRSDDFLLGGGLYQPNAYEFKWPDCPALVTGEFYAYFDGTTQLVIFEDIYVGD